MIPNVLPVNVSVVLISHRGTLFAKGNESANVRVRSVELEALIVVNISNGGNRTKENENAGAVHAMNRVHLRNGDPVLPVIFVNTLVTMY